jgi:hypothetical protein
MSRQQWMVGLLVVASASLSGSVWSPARLAAAQPAEAESKRLTFDNCDALTGWTISGDAAIDPAKGRAGQGGALGIGPGGKALLKLRDKDESGKVELWVYDDGTTPENRKAGRVGPRWGWVQNDGRLLAVGVLYASYLGGDEGYTATVCDGAKWFDELAWLGVKRAPAGWHKWTLNFDAEEGMYEDDAQFVQTIKEATGKDHNKDWARQGQAWDPFVNEMWARHRPTLQAPTDGWNRQHDDSYYRAALAEPPTDDRKE